MKRLTKRTELGVSIDKNEDCPSCNICWNCNISPRECEYINDALEKLADYEDLEEQGRLVKLPCKVGDTVYRINKGAKEPIIKMRVLQVHFKQLHKNRTIIRIDTINDNDMGENCYLLEDFGKTVFLTKSEAEAKLKELRGEQYDGE